jgi:hypothetical protein
LRASDGGLVASIAFKREKENPVKYKVMLKAKIYELISNNKNIVKVYYEEPFVGYVSAAKRLFMLSTFMEELKYENEPELDYLQVFEINNLKWKKDFLDPIKCPQGTKLQKEYVRNKLIGSLPFLSEITQDEVDAISMGYATISKGTEEKPSKVHEFKYNVEFVGADDDEPVIDDILRMDGIPDIVKSNGVVFKRLAERRSFDKQIFEIMGSDDKLLILKFSSDKYGNIILQHRLGMLASEYDFIYAAVWRARRKK